jgi:hypothetical protein
VSILTSLSAGTSTSFQTDTDISGNQNRGERELQRWVPEGPDNTDYSLESSNTGTWDQFATNSQLFGAQSTYDENLYTTAIDRNAPSYKRREAEAERIAREIEGSSSTNTHVREERGLVAENDGDDEEEKYSGVRRDAQAYPPLSVGGANKYTPPARRAPTGQATVPGVPVDPAIISAQLYRPDPAASQHPDPAPASEQDTSTATVQVRDQNGTANPSSTDRPDESAAQASQAEATNAGAQTGAKTVPQGPTDNVEAKVLHQFRQFADTERQRFNERRKAQQNQDRAAKLNELLRFSKTFKLKTPIPNDLIGILAKDPAKQEAIVEKAHKESAESAAAPATTSKSTPSQAPSASTANPMLCSLKLPCPIDKRSTVAAERIRKMGGRTALPVNNKPFILDAITARRSILDSTGTHKTAKEFSRPRRFPHRSPSSTGAFHLPDLWLTRVE